VPATDIEKVTHAMSQHAYGDAFMNVTSQSRSSAERIIAKIAPVLAPESVADFGCARGTWLGAWARAGVAQLQGVDGDYLKGKPLEVDAALMTFTDLAKPIALGRRFDLVQSLEVAEHLPPDASRVFVETLARHSDRVMFSAAPPGQGGEHHTNERPYEFWRDLFAEQGFAMFDWVRPLIASDVSIRYWYRYNVFLFVRESAVDALPAEIAATRASAPGPVADVSPQLFQLRKRVVRHLPVPVQNGIAAALARLRGAG
jgi:hypothetical protein